MNRAVFVAACLVTSSVSFAGEPQLAKTDPKTWAKTGWQEFRFGMGLGDVAELATRVAPKALLPFHRIDDDTYGHDPISSLAGEQVSATFDFLDGRLAQVTLAPRIHSAELDAWRRSVRRALEAKYGEGVSLPSVDAWSWRRAGLVIRETPFGVWFSDPRAEAEQRRRQQARDRKNAEGL